MPALLLAIWAGAGESRSAAAGQPNYFTRLWQVGDDGLPENNVTSVVQTRDGYLWLGTRSGLVRFDGVRFTVFNSSTTPVMRSSDVSCLFEAEEGTLWIGHHDGEVTAYKEGKFTAVPIRARWHRGKIFAVCPDADGDIWLLNQNGELGRVKDGFVIPWPSSKTVHLLAVARNPKGGFWIQRDDDVSLLERGRLRPMFDESSADRYVQGIWASPDGGLFVVVNRHAREWKDQKWIEDEATVPWDWTPSPATIVLKGGALAVATSDHGFFLISPGHEVSHFCRTNGFSSDWVNALCEDREGNLWVGTGNGGLAMLRLVNMRTLNPPDAWQGRAVLSVDMGADGTLWAGTEGAGLYSLRDGNWRNYTSEDGLSNYYNWSVAPDAPGGVWVGSWGTGVYALKGSRFECPPGLGELYAGALLVSLHEGVLVGTSEGLLRFEGGRTNWLGRSPELFSPDVRAICEGADGTVWFGMSGGGLGHWKEGKLWQFRRSDGLSSDFVQCLHLEEDGTLWIGTAGGGLDRFKEGRFVAIGKSQGLPDDVICDVEDDGLGFFWMSSHNGIIRVSKSDLAGCADGVTNQLHCLTFGSSDGLPSLECSGGIQPAGCKTAGGRLLFPTVKGLVEVDPKNITTNPFPPPVVIEEIRVDDEPVAARAGTTAAVEIAPGRHRLELDYAGLSLAAPERVRFKYRLDGLDRGWVEVGAKRTANYSYIPPGPYVFRVTACNHDGVWNETGASLALQVLPFFWQTWWFRALAGLGGAAVLGGSVLVATRRRMRRKLERLEREQAIERERTRIAKDIHDDLGASLTRISMLSQSARSELGGSPEAAAQVDQICRTARELTRTMDEIVWAINPQHDSLDSLANYLGKFAQDYLRAAGIRCRLNMPEELPLWALTAEVRHGLFLAFKEALNNVVKHSGATEVWVALTPGASGFALAVQDNGRGFSPNLVPREASADPDRIGGGHGLVNMKLRLEEIGGRCEIQSAPRAGTTVKFDAPMKAARFEQQTGHRGR
ncbi:MAG: two-component regulator propeller domain-containing protein [Verrucomicrobiota bacterium]